MFGERFLANVTRSTIRASVTEVREPAPDIRGAVIFSLPGAGRHGVYLPERRQTQDHINGNKGLTGFITRRRRTSPNIHGNRATFEAPERPLSRDAKGGIGSYTADRRQAGPPNRTVRKRCCKIGGGRRSAWWPQTQLHSGIAYLDNFTIAQAAMSPAFCLDYDATPTSNTTDAEHVICQ
jgi:hypothetical protein